MLTPDRYLGNSYTFLSDDDAGGPLFLQRLLRASGVRNNVMSYPRAEYVVEFLCCCSEEDPEKTPKLILLAMDNPEHLGFEIVEWIRSKDAFDQTALVMLSPIADLQYAQCAHRMGVDALLYKYPGPNMLRNVLARVLRYRVLVAGSPEIIYA